jgi:hypothetical protein
MVFDWKEYLKFAKKLSEQQDEAAMRSAVSRAYYCAYNLALSRARANKYRSPEDTGSHDALWELYKRNAMEHRLQSCDQLASIGARLKRKRVQADYRDNFARLPEAVKDAIEDAEQCVALLSALDPRFPQDIPRSFHF